MHYSSIGEIWRKLIRSKINVSDDIWLERISLSYPATYIAEIIEIAEGLPAQEKIAEELDAIRDRRPDILSRIQEAEQKELKTIRHKLLIELGQLKYWRPAITSKGRAAVEIAQASTRAHDGYLLEQDVPVKILSENVSEQNINIMKNIREYSDQTTQSSRSQFNTFTNYLKRSSSQAIKSHRQALHSASLLILTSWLVRQAFLILWSLILGTLALDLINGKTEDHLKELLKPHLSYLAKVGIAPGRLDLLIWAIVLTLGWFIVERIIRPWCERLGEKLERYSVSHLASDVLDLAFRTRIYRVAIDAGYRAALKRAASCLPEVEKSRVEEIKTSSGFEKSFKRDHVQFWLGSAPDIATISSLGTIPEIVERVHSGELDVITAVDEGPEGAMRLRNRFERSEPLRG